MLERIKEAVEYIQQFLTETPEYAVVLGSGLGKLQDEVENPIFIDYKDIPHFPQSTVKGHSGQLIFGKIENRYVLMMAGRFHYYEGYSMEKVTFPMRVRSEEHTSELQSRGHLVCRLLLEKKNFNV